MVINMEMFIYVLIDPRNLEIRYVGKTNNPKERMRAHISPHIYMRHNNKKCIWIEELRSIGLRPTMQVMTSCPSEKSHIYEHMYFKLFNTVFDLLNAQTIAKETLQYSIKF